MRHMITELDRQTLRQPVLNYKYRVYVTDDDGLVLGELKHIQNLGPLSIDAESDNRRTASLTFLLSESYYDMEKLAGGLMKLNFKIQIGIQNLRMDDYIWYDMGTFVVTDSNTAYDAVTNSLSVSLSDWFARLNGIRNGQIGGSPIIIIPAVNRDGIKNTLKSQLLEVLRQETGIRGYIIEDIGEFYGMRQNNPDWEEYRRLNPDWDKLPYDLEFNIGCSVSDIINEITGLYPNIQKYFDIYNNFCCNMTPSCEHDPVVLDDEFLQSILLQDASENVTYDVRNIKNVTEVFGAIYDIDRQAESCDASGNTYLARIPGYEKYRSGDYIAFTPPSDNTANMYFQINTLEPVPIYREYTADFIDSGTMMGQNLYVGQLKTVDRTTVMYFLGQYQPHAVCVLSNDAEDSYYTQAYFQAKYNCKNVTVRIEKDSPFAVQKIGEVLDEKQGAEFEHIRSESVAMENAVYHNRKTSTLNDTITITTKLIPWIPVHAKVSYRKKNDSQSRPYIIKSVSHNPDSCTSSITMYRFNPL